MLPRLQDMAAGDVLIGLASTGVHSNGFSLCRKILASRRNPETGAQWSLFDSAPFNPSITLGDALLVPTRIYVKSLLPVIRAGHVMALAHITGGGLWENLPRVLPDHLAGRLNALSWKFPALFRWLMTTGGVSWEEMARTFNCGIGMILVVKPADVPAVLKQLENVEEAFVIGHLEQRTSPHVPVIIEDAPAAWCSGPAVAAAATVPAASPASTAVTRRRERSSSSMSVNPPRVAVCIEAGASFDGLLDALLHHSGSHNTAFHFSLAVFVGESMDTTVAEKCDRTRVRCVHVASQENVDRLFGDLDAVLRENDIEYVCWKRARMDETLEAKLSTRWKGRLLSSTPALSLPVSPSGQARFDPTDLAQFELAVRSNCRFHGTTVHLLVPDVEQTVWPILWQELVEVAADETAATLAEKVTDRACEGKAFVEAVRLLATGCVFYEPGRGIVKN